MAHQGHALIVLATAILLIGSGIVVVVLGWSRRYRGGRSDMVVGALSRRQVAMSVAGVPLAGTIVLLAIVVVAAALR